MSSVLRQARREDIDGMHRVRMVVRENRLASTVIKPADYVEHIESLGQGWVVEVDGRIVAFAIGNVKTGNIWALFVDPAYEGHGYGRQLHDTMLDWLWSKGIEQLWLTTAPNTRAQRFYEAAGWKNVGQADSGEMRFEKRRLSQIRSATPDDAAAIAGIYNHYILNTCVTFEEEAISSGQMQTRIEDTLVNYPWLICERNGVIEGYAYAAKWHARRSYRRSVETTVYLDSSKVGDGRGSRLYTVLLQSLRERGFHTAIGGIALPNERSIALHEKFGFEKVAHYKEVGWKFDRWIDVGYWQLML